MSNSHDEIAISDVVAILWARRFLIALVTLAFGSAALLTAFNLPESYKSTVVLSHSRDDAADKLGGAGALLSQFGGVAALGGLSGGSSSGRKAEALATLTSAAITEAFIRENNLLPLLYEDDWDAKRKAWKVTGKKIPTVWKAELIFSKYIRTVVEDKKTGLITLTISWKNPVQAAAWAGELVSRTNVALRARSINQSQRNLDYLNEQLTKSNVVELQKAIYALIESEIKQIMIAKGSEEYAFRVIDPPRISEVRSSPKRGLITLIGLFAGFMLGTLVAVASSGRSSNKA